MSKSPEEKKPLIDPYIVSVIRYRLQRIINRIPLSSVVWGIGLLVFLAVVFWKVPTEVPGLVQRGLALVFTALVAAVYFQATREPDFQDDLVARMQRGQHIDFGKQLRAVKHERRKVNLPVLGETTLRSIIGVAIVVLSFTWWLTPIAPVAVAQPQVEDVAIPLTEEILAVSLVCPDGDLVTVRPPIRPMEARRLAALIPETAPKIMLARKAISQGKFALAEEFICAANIEEDADTQEIDITRAQKEMYACNFEEALACYLNALDRDSQNPTILCQAAVAALHATEYHEAQQLIAQALKICREREAELQNTLSTVNCLEIQAALFTIVGYRFDIVEKHNRQALDLWAEGELPEHHSIKAACLNNQGVLFSITDNLPGARSMNAWAIDVWRQLDERSPQLAFGLGNKAMLHKWEGRYIESQFAADRQLEMLRNTLPTGHPAIALGTNTSVLADLAIGEYRRNDPEDVKALITIFEKRFGQKNPALAMAMNAVAESCLAVALPSVARAYCEQALEATEASLGANHPYMIAGLLNSSRVFFHQGNTELALESCRRARQIAEEVFGADHTKVARCLFWEGKILLAQGKPDEAKPLLQKSLEIIKERFGDVHPQIAETLACLASMNNSPRMLKKDLALYEEALQIYEQLLGSRCEEHPAVARLLSGMAKLTAKTGHTEEAIALLDRCLDIQEKTLVSYDPELAEALLAKAELLHRQNAQDDEKKALALEKRAEQIRRDYEEENRR